MSKLRWTDMTALNNGLRTFEAVGQDETTLQVMKNGRDGWLWLIGPLYDRHRTFACGVESSLKRAKACAIAALATRTK